MLPAMISAMTQAMTMRATGARPGRRTPPGLSPGTRPAAGPGAAGTGTAFCGRSVKKHAQVAPGAGLQRAPGPVLELLLREPPGLEMLA
jgi:hypothetical protein